MEPIKDKIDGIEFRVLSPKLGRKLSAVKIMTPELYDADGYPVDNGLMDLRMGVIDPGLRCRTCGSRVQDCPGHFGHIELARPVIHVEYIPYIYDFIRATCRSCGRVMLSEPEMEKWREKIESQKEEDALVRQDVVKNLMKKLKNTTKCPHCGGKQGKIKLQKPTTFIEDNKKLTPIDVRERLERIPDSDLIYLGMNIMAGRPEWMILTNLLVPPNTVRPSITLESGQRSEDDLTHKLGDIVRTNQRLSENISAGAPQIIIDDLWDLLQYHVTTFFNNSISQVPPARHRSGRILKTLSDRIKSKDGRFRHNLAGKRVDFSSRTVISPDSMIKPDEVGVPLEIAKELTIPERVTEWNIDWLKKFIKSGEEYPGANYVITPNGRKRVFEDAKEMILQELAPGDVVERHLIDGDLVLFNRQPSLHRMSIMAHKVRVLPHKTFRINPAVVNPYNADFDGDEMNLHVPQTEEARAEADVLMALSKHIITPRYGYPIIGASEDYVLGCYLLTVGQKKFSKEVAMQMMVSSGIEDIPNKSEFTGKEIFSLVFPKDLSYVGNLEKAKESEKKKDDKTIVIRNGQLICGIMDKRAIGAGKGSVLQEIYKQYGPERSLEILERITLLGINTLMHLGYSVSPQDTDVAPNTYQKVKEKLLRAEEKSEELIKLYEIGKLEPYPGRTMRETLESSILPILNKARDETGDIVLKELVAKRRTTLMMMSGASGSKLNLILMSCCVGQQNLRGFRINRGFTGRTLSHFRKGDLGAQARGFIRHGYKAGLTPTEFFFHAISGRDSLVNKGMRTPKSGYLQRRLVNALQDIKVFPDGTIRDGSSTIVQFSFGEDGIDVSKSDGGTVDVDTIIRRNVSK
jgi:DNA-directed RNA polymerase subunit A'